MARKYPRYLPLCARPPVVVTVSWLISYNKTVLGVLIQYIRLLHRLFIVVLSPEQAAARV